MLKFFLDLLKKALVLVVGYFLLLGLGLVFFWWSMQQLEREPRVIEGGSVLVIDLAMNVPDAPPTAGLPEIINQATGGSTVESVHLLRFLDALREARNDERIDQILFHGNLTPVGYGAGFAALSEIRGELLQFREAGKRVTFYLHGPGLRELFLASGADTVFLNPFSEINLSGMAITTPFFAGALERLGIGVQVFRAGDFKSAIEPFVEQSFSAENREQLTEVVQTLWQTVGQPIAEARSLELGTLSRGGLHGSGIYLAADALRVGLVDDILYFDELLERLNLGEHEGAAPQVTLKRYLRDLSNPETGSKAAARLRRQEADPAEPGILAVVYAEGDIVDGWGSTTNVGGDWLAFELRRLRQDARVAGVVLRINSPGGSAVASEMIHREVALLAETKPLVVSFGSIAASGGYWIATPAHRIFMDPLGLTGSIGVFGLAFQVEEGAKRLGITFDQVKTGDFADLMSIARPQTKEEIALFQSIIDLLYEEFLARVMDGRGVDREQAVAAAGGRVFLGQRAAALTLADEFGGLRAALSETATRAGLSLDEVEIVEIPGLEPPVNALLRLFDTNESQGELARVRSRATFADVELESYLRPGREFLEAAKRGRVIQARLPFDFILPH